MTIRRTAERYADLDSCDRTVGRRYMDWSGGRGSVAPERTCMLRKDLTSPPSSEAPILVARFRFVDLQSGQQQVSRAGNSPARGRMTTGELLLFVGFAAVIVGSTAAVGDVPVSDLLVGAALPMIPKSNARRLCLH